MQDDLFGSFSYDTTFIHRFYNEIKDDSLNINYDFANIPSIKFCRERISDVSIQNDTYIFDVSKVNGII